MQGISSTGWSPAADLAKRAPTQALAKETNVSAVAQNADASLTEKRGVDKIASTSNQVETDQKAFELMESVNQQMEAAQLGFRFKSDDASGRFVFSIYDVDTKEVIRQIPSEAVLTTSQQLKEYMDRKLDDPKSAQALGVLLNSEA